MVGDEGEGEGDSWRGMPREGGNQEGGSSKMARAIIKQGIRRRVGQVESNKEMWLMATRRWVRGEKRLEGWATMENQDGDDGDEFAIH